ncbi:SpoIIE family protein phosphatase [Streptomyces sp. NPDC059944]|uniref:SpoIIE family protein phosphatase n=1 Tax=unclassified Streptomyces TaxID=2593676 RepID=UPI0036599471
MLRQADLDHAGQGPARALSAMEHTNARLDVNASDTLVHAHLRPHPQSTEGAWELSWTNAGHPPPLVATPDGTVERLDQHGILLFPVFAGRPREEYRRLLAPGSLLLLYTDGLVERGGINLEILIGAAEERWSPTRSGTLTSRALSPSPGTEADWTSLSPTTAKRCRRYPHPRRTRRLRSRTRRTPRGGNQGRSSPWRQNRAHVAARHIQPTAHVACRNPLIPNISRNVEEATGLLRSQGSAGETPGADPPRVAAHSRAAFVWPGWHERGTLDMAARYGPHRAALDLHGGWRGATAFLHRGWALA